MKAEVAFTPVLTAARALKLYTTPPRWHTTTRLLHLHTSGHTLTLSATTGEETAQVDLPGAIADGHVAIPPDTLVKALTAMRPKGKAAATATRPAAAVQRATKLLTACDPHGQLRVDVDDERIRWQTSTVRVYARTRGEPFPNLEKLREDVCSDANIRFTVDQPALLAALDTAAALAATTRRGTLRVEPASGGAVVDVTVYADSGAVLHRTPVPIGAATRPTQALTFKPAFARHAIAFLDRPTVAVAATTGHLAVYLYAGDRHAIVMQTAA